MAHIVVMGAGVGGMPAAYELRALLPAEHRITVVNPTDTFQFTPSNPWVAVGWRERSAVTLPIGPLLERKGIAFVASAVSKIDPAANRVTLENGQALDYDYLVITTGPKLSFDEVPGAGPHGGHTHSVCTVGHAEMFWAEYQKFLEAPGPIVVGAMPGASCFGPAYEFAFILDADLRKRKLRHKVPMTYVTAEPYIGHLGLGGVGDSKSMLESELRGHDIKWITSAKTTKVEPGKLFTTQLDDLGNVMKEHEVPFKLAMMLPAFKGVEPVAAIADMCNPRGFVLIDEHQRSKKYRNIFSAGVCVAIPPVEVTPVPSGAPKTGYMIETMVTAIAHNIAAELAGQPATAKGTWNAICLADMGDTGAAFVALPQIPPRNVNWFKKGKWVHYAKIAFEKYFMRKMKTGNSDPVYEKYVLKALGIVRLADRG
ncbi:NAD(P)/FAD-dependent oxidoreductase [Piscinibacter sp.]|uniref:NAD(P)/FAD-dependent oxidoreductase n=1 Tax=Piscinibacter sp. TaxID=1903157 RepID=UPI001B6682D0|nr:FAD-dependent oxidoreductase [Piscinibacter sp.]MBP5991944.1 FAD-dependent oxidoreductase [Piscinibacter sp.]MBP6029365.1 FAD-dependent oxidoreductase [Piscinibacter sp.]